ncbi:hypothetical protein QYF36_016888 [Acer negundo]|nr:hypothetical protein QYF36_016888 [Acer negundo]
MQGASSPDLPLCSLPLWQLRDFPRLWSDLSRDSGFELPIRECIDTVCLSTSASSPILALPLARRLLATKESCFSRSTCFSLGAIIGASDVFPWISYQNLPLWVSPTRYRAVGI